MMNVALMIFLILCVLCAVLLLIVLIFGSRQEQLRSIIDREIKQEEAQHEEP